MKPNFGFIRDNRGVATVEFVFSIFTFVIMLFFVAEIARISYISAVLDLAVSEAAKEAKNAPDYETKYEDRFRSRFKHGGAIWSFLTYNNAVSMKIFYSNSIPDMFETGGVENLTKDSALARYWINYNYKPMFFPFPRSYASNLLTRR
ncbi:TadE family protein [Apirhabdus apintestini]|nr:TadE family protein [Enterobacteriaceae bacterium CA-0114]